MTTFDKDGFPTSDILFAYGTIKTRPDRFGYIRGGHLKVLGGGTIQGTMKRLEGKRIGKTEMGYPAVIAGEGIIHGELMQLTDHKFWQSLYWLESYHGEPKYDKYLPTEVEVTTPDGKTTKAIAFIANRKNTSLLDYLMKDCPTIEDGNFDSDK